MADDKAPLQSEEEEVKTSEEQAVENEGEEKMIPKSRLDKVIEQREELKAKYEETSGKLSSLEETINELRESVSEKQEKSSGETFTAEEEQALDRVAKGLKGKKFITKEDLDEIRRIDQRNNELNRLQSTYKKGSGYPAFKSDEVMVHAQKKGFGDNLEAAYFDLHREAIIQVEAEKLAKGVNPPDSEKPTGGDREAQTQLTRNAVAEMDVNEWNQNRESIMDKFRKSVFGK